MKVIKKGQLPQDKVYRCTCPNCKTEFEFKAAEAKLVSDQRDGDFYSITCPLEGCGRVNTVDTKYNVKYVGPG